MAVQIIHNVTLSGIAAAVPASVYRVRDAACFDSTESCDKFIANVGVEEVRSNDGSITTSDLCQRAAERLMEDINWKSDAIDLLVFLSQTPDYPLPATACVLHGKMGLKQDCMSFDISLGCSGWTYGMSIIAGLMETGVFKKALLLMGDVHPASPEHRTYVKPLFGNAGTATALEYQPNSSPIIVDTKTDGTGYDAIIRRAGGCRHPFTPECLEYKPDKYGDIHRAIDTEMDGPAVFIFGITKVPRAVKQILKIAGKNVDEIDAFFFHQANRMMNEQIRRKCKIPADKCPYSLKLFGNNGSASIPLTMVTEERMRLHKKKTQIVACAFGVGLSWGTLYMELNAPYISELVEV